MKRVHLLMVSAALLMTFLWGGCGGRGPQITGEEFAGRLPSVLTKTDTIETSEETIQEIQEVLSSAPPGGDYRGKHQRKRRGYRGRSGEGTGSGRSFI